MTFDDYLSLYLEILSGWLMGDKFYYQVKAALGGGDPGMVSLNSIQKPTGIVSRKVVNLVS